MDEGILNVLEHYFEMSRPDSEHALRIYKTFTVQTEEVVKVLHVARRFEAATRLEIPDFEHASTDLTRLLEDDLNSPDFEVRRREYLAAKEAKRRGGPIYSTCSTPNKTALTSKPMLSLLQTQAETKSAAASLDATGAKRNSGTTTAGVLSAGGSANRIWPVSNNGISIATADLQPFWAAAVEEPVHAIDGCIKPNRSHSFTFQLAGLQYEPFCMSFAAFRY